MARLTDRGVDTRVDDDGFITSASGVRPVFPRNEDDVAELPEPDLGMLHPFDTQGDGPGLACAILIALSSSALFVYAIWRAWSAAS